MPTAATADQIRNRPIFVSIPGGDLAIECRRPDPLALIASNLLPLEIFADVLGVIAQWNTRAEGPATDRELTDQLVTSPRQWGAFIDRWASVAAVSPRIVLTEDERLTDPSALWVDDLELEVKLDILRRTNAGLRSPRLGTAVAEFRRLRDLRPESAGDRSDGETVRRETVGAAAGA